MKDIYYLEKEQLKELIGKLKEEYQQVYLPVESDSGAIVYKVAGSELKDYKYVEKFVRPVSPLKQFFLKVREKVAEYPVEEKEGSLFDVAGAAIVGVTACDIKAVQILDKLFIDKELFPDVFWEQRRENSFLVSIDCEAPQKGCFCTKFENGKPYAEKGYDINLSRIKEGFLISAGTEKGKKILESLNLTKAEKAQIEELKAKREEVIKLVNESNKEFKFASDYRKILYENVKRGKWKKEVGSCVECGACLFVCPMCHCFLLYDRKKEEINERLRVWDACIYAGYSRMAGGGTPRGTIERRLLNRYQHKFDYFKTNLDEYGCVACGRCISSCTGAIDIREMLSDDE